LAVIGRGWLLAANEYGQRRIDFDDDWVAIELSRALGEPEVTVIPVLVDGAKMPPADAFPRQLRSLANKNAITLLHEGWDDTSKRLLEKVAQVLRPNDASNRRTVVEAITPDLIRQIVTNALESADNVRGQVVLATVDDISRIVAAMCARDLRADEISALELLIRRLVGRSVVQVAAYMGEFLGVSFSFPTNAGKWLGYAMSGERTSYEVDYTGCLLLLPGPSLEGRVAQVTGVAVAKAVSLDYYGAASNEPPGPYTSATGPIIQVGTRF